jgi:hypothetical protein
MYIEIRVDTFMYIWLQLALHYITLHFSTFYLNLDALRVCCYFLKPRDHKLNNHVGV